jgi:putative endonuclease
MVGQDAQIAVYIMASGHNSTLYTGVTSALFSRVQQHNLGLFEGFSKDHGCKFLVWFEDHASMMDAIVREKRIKRRRRAWKLALIEADTPHWRACLTAGSTLRTAPCRGRRTRSFERGAAGSRISALYETLRPG